MALGAAQAQIHVDGASIGCLDIQKEPNLAGLVASTCNGKTYCSYKAPSEDEYKAPVYRRRQDSLYPGHADHVSLPQYANHRACTRHCLGSETG
jgi:hypothetical protein